MRWKHASMGAALLLAACADGSGREATAPRTAIALTFAEALEGPAKGTVIEVVVHDPLPLTSAELAAPDGTVAAAPGIERSALPILEPPARPTFGFGMSGGSSSGISSGVGISLPIGGIGGPPRAREIIESRALVPVRDAQRFREAWQAYTVRLRLGTPPGDSKDFTFPAPNPNLRPR